MPTVRIRTALECPAVQIDTGLGCHLEASMVRRGLDTLSPGPGTLVLVENVGNLVCPALFDLGETARVVLMSVTEGEDKPAKYPHLFRTADLVVITKIDLLPWVPFDCDVCVGWARRVRPDAPVLRVSARTGEGMDGWLDRLREVRDAAGG